MALGIYTGVAFAVVAGDISPAAAAVVDVKREDTNTAAAIFSDRAGTAPLVNPSALADANGRFQFYAAPLPQGYKITVTGSAGAYTLRNQQVHLDASAFGMTVLDDADAPGARGTLVAMPNVFTTKGDVVVGGAAAGAPTRKAVGADGSALVADAAQPDGLKWAPVASQDDAIAYAIALG